MVTKVFPIQGGTGLTTLGSANQIIGVNAGATGFEYKTLVAGTNVTIEHGAGTITISASGGGTPGGSDTQVQFNDAGSFGGDAGFTYDKITDVATIGGLVLSGLTASQLIATDASSKLVSLDTATYPSLTELSYVKGVTSAIQAQLDDKAATDQTMYIGTTAHAINRASAPEALSGITGLTPGANFTLTQNSVAVLTSEETGAVANTLYLKQGNVGIGTTSPTAYLHLKAGTATANTAPLKFTSGTNLTTPEAGAIEFDGTDLFFTPSTTRYTILHSGKIGVSIQAYSSNLDTWSGKTAPSGTVVGTSDTQTLTNKTITDSSNTIVSHLAINTQTDTSYTLALSDDGKLVQMNNSSANTLTIPTNSSVAFPTGTKIMVQKYGSGNTTIQGASGVTLRDPNGLATISTQYDSRVLVKLGTDEWLIV